MKFYFRIEILFFPRYYNISIFSSKKIEIKWFSGKLFEEGAGIALFEMNKDGGTG